MSEMALVFGEEVAQRGWQTGSVMPTGMIDALVPHLTRPHQAPPVISDTDWLVLVSQTCDIVASKLEAEPLVEILHCKPHAGKPRKGRRNLESTRYLDFYPNRKTHQNLVLSAHALEDRYVIPRKLLAEYKADELKQADERATQKILAWYALRSGRPSWPNTFCDRLRTVGHALEQALDSLEDEIAEVRVAIDEKHHELMPAQPYRVAVFFVVDEEIWHGNVDCRQAINKAFMNFVAALQECKGIAVNEELSGVVPGHEFTWQETRQTDLWDFANLSHRD